MKFLMITDDSQTTPESAYVAMEANERWLDELRRRGILETIYSLAGNHGVAMILNVETAEHLDEVVITGQSPRTIRIYPLADYGHAMNLMKAHYKRILASMKSDR